MSGMAIATILAGAFGAALAMFVRPIVENLGRGGRLVATNYEGRALPVAGSAPWILAVVAAGLGLGGARLAGCDDTALARQAMTVAAGVLAASLVGVVDDLSPTAVKGFRGHLGAALRGEITPGFLKLGLVGAAALAVAAAKGGGPLEALLDGALIALFANLLNLLDLRPGRALKAGVALAALGIGAAAATSSLAGPARGELVLLAAFAAPGVSFLRHDLARAAMLGDGGANPLGFLLGCLWVSALSATIYGKAILLILVIGVNLFAERGSITSVVESNRILKALDEFGVRRDG